MYLFRVVILFGLDCNNQIHKTTYDYFYIFKQSNIFRVYFKNTKTVNVLLNQSHSDYSFQFFFLVCCK